MKSSKPDIDALRSRLRTALLAGEDASVIRSDIASAERARRDNAEASAHAARRAKEAESAAIQREARTRAEASARRLQTLLSTLEA